MNTDGLINGKHYSKYAGIINDLVRDKKYEEAEKLLIEIIGLMESIAMNRGEGVAPGYYVKLAGTYKKTGQKEKEIKTIKRFLLQIKSMGSGRKKIYEKYVKLMKVTDEHKLQRDIYNEYLSKLENTKLKTIKKKCSCCGNIGVYPIPQLHYSFPEGFELTQKESDFLDEMRNTGIKMFGTCCAFCYESMMVSTK